MKLVRLEASLLPLEIIRYKQERITYREEKYEVKPINVNKMEILINLLVG